MTNPKASFPTRPILKYLPEHEYVEKLDIGSMTEEAIAANTTKAMSAETVTNDITCKFLRTFHPTLARLDTVGAFTYPGNDFVWFVFDPSALQVRSIGGRPLYFMPMPISPIHNYHIASDPLWCGIDPTKEASEATIKDIRTIFPLCKSITIYCSGFIGFGMSRDDLFENVYTGLYWPGTLGGLRVGLGEYCVVSATAKTRESSVGLRLRLSDGLECISGATSALVTSSSCDGKHEERGCARKTFRKRYGLVDWFINMVTGIWIFGKRMCLPDKVILPETVIRSFDRPSRFIPYPYGYMHNLALLTTPNGLPAMTTPPGMPALERSFAAPESALDGNPVFAYDNEAHNNEASGGTTREEIVEAIRYDWETSSKETRRSLLWRTVPVEQSLASSKHASGSVLCLGKPADSSAKAICFQSFECPIPVRRLTLAKYLEFRDWADCPGRGKWCYKGGFLLPKEVMEAEIIVDRPEPVS
ncbi:hypothetical protein BJ508DRAFT_312745 [Ascobolus immersus RN42]|uniref:Uncharacterized protein n=1 Tax=Ascobolus immersus RN42 TaxID=1160509 RepID=A0A3N4HQ12_ASCIM|nr:hypothetical protein BJ508DRAFT_312745 [Ascobolus immersus RN42]